MKLLTAEEARNITKENIKSNVLDRVMNQINNAAKNGQYGLKLREDYSKEESDLIFDLLLNLGYKVERKTQTYIGTLKSFTELIINWHD